MSKHKAEIEKTLSKIKRDYESLLEQNRVEWLQRVIKEGRDLYAFQDLGQLLTFVVNHAAELQQSSEAHEKIRKRGAKGSCTVHTSRLVNVATTRLSLHHEKAEEPSKQPSTEEHPRACGRLHGRKSLQLHR